MIKTRTEKNLFLSSLIIPVAIIAIGSIYAYLIPRPLQEALTEKQELPGKVLGYESPQLFISSPDEGYGSFGIISQSIYSKPEIRFSAYNAKGEGTVRVFRTNKEELLTFLTHDGKSNQTTPLLSTTDKEKLLEKKIPLTSANYDSAQTLMLPINEEKGLWLIELEYENQKTQSILVRSGFGVYTANTERDMLFWAQDFKSGKSISDIGVDQYALNTKVEKISSRTTNEKGILGVEIDTRVDIALAEKDNDLAVIPINLSALNYYNRYERFIKTEPQTAYFTFTDRPIYKPGDTIFFKSILREGLDKKYSIANGTATVRIIKTWPGSKKIFEKEYQISSLGELNGEFKIPESETTGTYELVVQRKGSDEYNTSTTYFDITFYRKPEYSIDLTTPTIELVRGDKAQATVTATYFSGEPVRNREVAYTIYTGGYSDYEYSSQIELSDKYRYGYWYGDKLQTGTVVLDSNGQAKIPLNTDVQQNDGNAKVWGVEVELDDGSGNPAFARKNILVRQGEWGIYRNEGQWYAKVDQAFEVPIVLRGFNGEQTQNQKLNINIKNTQWEKYQDPKQKYPQYREKVSHYNNTSITTDNTGNAKITFIPDKEGSYEITIDGKDKRGNTITKKIYTYASKADWITKEYSKYMQYSQIQLSTDKAEFEPNEAAKLYVQLNDLRDRDVLVTVNGQYVDRYQVVSVPDQRNTANIELVESDIPNRFISAVTFTETAVVSDVTEIKVGKNQKQLNVRITSESKTAIPGQALAFNIETTDTKGNPVPASVTLWGIDKALLELSDSNLGSIYSTFWSGRYYGTRSANSLEGIYSESAERGGCFTSDVEVLMSNGSKKKISEIKVGDEIGTRESETKSTIVSAKVSAIMIHEITGYLIINGELKITPEHILYVNNKWREAGSIKLGDKLTNIKGINEKVESIEWVNAKETVYNLEIENKHTFFAQGYWVHNEKGGGGTVRQNLKDTAYWNPDVQTDSNGRATVRVKLPDNLTTWIFSAVGATTQTVVGQNQAEVQTTKDIIVRPILPNIVRVGDKIRLSALVYNGTNNEHTFNVSAEYAPAEINNKFQTITIKAKETAQVYFDANINRVDKDTIKFSATDIQDKNLTDAIQLKLPILPFEVTTQKGESAVNNYSYNISTAPDTDSAKSKVTLVLATSITDSVKTALKYLIEYPYGCTEQTTSRLVPIIIAKKYPQIFSEAIKEHQENLDKMLSQGFQRLKAYQRPDGGWTWWGSGPSDPYVSAYVAEYLVLAEQENLDFDQSLLDDVKRYFENMQPKSDQDKVARAYARSLWDTNTEPISVETIKNLPVDLIPLAVLANQQLGIQDSARNGLDILRQKAVSQGDTLVWPEGDQSRFGSQFTTTALAVRALNQDKKYQEDARRGLLYILRNKKYEYWGNSYASAQIIRTVGMVEESQQSNEYTYQVVLDGVQIAQGKVTPRANKIPSVEIPGSKLKANSRIDVQKNGTGDLYSTMLFSHTRTSKEIQEESNGISIKRTYISEKGENYSLAVGDKVTVQLEISGLKQPEQYAVVHDELPAGLSPINKLFNNEQGGDEYSDYYYSSYDTEYTQNGAIIALSQLNTTQTVKYEARVISEGIFTAPPATASLMYAPEINGMSAVSTLTTEKEAQKLFELKGSQKPGINFTLKNRTQSLEGFIMYLAMIGVAVGGAYAYERYKKKHNPPHNNE